MTQPSNTSEFYVIHDKGGTKVWFTHTYCKRVHSAIEWCPKRVAEAITMQSMALENLSDADKHYLAKVDVSKQSYAMLLEEWLATCPELYESGIEYYLKNRNT